MAALRFSIPGECRGKGRPRFGKGRTYTDAKTQSYEGLVAYTAMQAMGPLAPFAGPIAVDLTFRLVPPVSESKKRRAEMLAGHREILGRFDIDNLAKAVLDGLNRVAFVDDRQIVGLSARKRAAEMPGVDVTITSIGGSE